MKEFFNKLYRNHSIIYKAILCVVSVLLIVYFFPKGGKFPYEFQKGKPWQYETLVAPFNFAIEKTEEQIQQEVAQLKANTIPYFERTVGVTELVLAKVKNNAKVLLDTIPRAAQVEDELEDLVGLLYVWCFF